MCTQFEMGAGVMNKCFAKYNVDTGLVWEILLKWKLV